MRLGPPELSGLDDGLLHRGEPERSLGLIARLASTMELQQPVHTARCRGVLVHEIPHAVGQQVVVSRHLDVDHAIESSHTHRQFSASGN
jgi:hypothetical protein